MQIAMPNSGRQPLRAMAATIGSLVWILVSSIGVSQDSDTNTIRIMTYNIHHAEGNDRVLDLERIASVITEAEPDLVALQEVDKHTSRSDNVDQPSELSRLTGMHVVFAKNIDFQGGEYGTAILSRWPITDTDHFSLPNLNDGEQRGVQIANVRIDDRNDLTLVCTHFDHRRDDEERFQSAMAVKEWLDAQTSKQIILAGDLNDIRGSRTLRRLEEDWVILGDEETHTVSATSPTRQIDFVLVRRESDLKLRSVEAIDERVASDHLPLIAEIEWQLDRQRQ